MSRSQSIRRPFAAATAFAVLVGGLVLAPVVAAPAMATNASDSAALTTTINAQRNSLEVSSFASNPALTKFANTYAAAYAKKPNSAEPKWTTLPAELDTEVSPSVPVHDYMATKAIKSKTIQGIYDQLAFDSSPEDEFLPVVRDSAYNYAGISVVTVGSYKYAVVIVAHYQSAPVQFITTGTVKISGLATAGRTLKAVTTGWKAGSAPIAAGNFNYSWQVGGLEVGNGATFQVGGNITGKAIRLKVSAVTEGFRDSAVKTSVATRKVLKGTFSATTPVASGLRNVGQFLDAGESFQINGTPFTEYSVNFQWYRGATKIADAVDNDYYQLPGDKGKKISVKVTVSGLGYTTWTKQSSTKLVTGSPLLQGTKEPQISSPEGELVGGTVLTASTGGTWTAEAEGAQLQLAAGEVAYGYQWFIGTTAVKGATKSTYTVPNSAANKGIKVVVTGTLAGFAPTQRSSEPVFVGYKTWVTLPEAISISGSFVKGQKLVAAVPVTSPSGATVTYRWIDGNEKVLKGQTSRIHTVTAADIASGWLQVEAKLTLPGYAPRLVYGMVSLG